MAKFVDVEWIIQQLRDDPRLQSLPHAARADAEGDILATIYLRSIRNHRSISCSYIAKTVRYYLKPRRRGDPYVEKFRRLADKFQRKGLPVPASLLDDRRSIQTPVEELIQREEEQFDQEKLGRIHDEIKQLAPRSQSVLDKFLRGGPLTQAERCVRHRAVAAVKTCLSSQF